MFHIIFENDNGKIDMGGGQSDIYKIRAIDGLGLSGKAYTTVSYAGVAGQETVLCTPNARTITIAGDILGYDSLQYRISRALAVFDAPCVMRVYFGNRRRKITCNQASFELGERDRQYARFTLQLVCDNPYFSAFDEAVEQVYHAYNLLGESFTLPTMFSRRVTRCDVDNPGDQQTEPVISIQYRGDTGHTKTEEGIVVQNYTTGQRIKLACTVEEDETITIDIPDRTVTSNINGNLLGKLTSESYLSDFWLSPGVNDVGVTNLDESVEITASIRFAAYYREAVY